MNILRPILFVLLCLGGQAQAQSLLRVSFAVGPPPSGKVYGAAAEQAATTLSVVDGQRVVLQRTQGTDYRLEGGSQNWAWTQVQQGAANETTIAVTPRVHDGKVNVEVNYSKVQGDASTHYSSTVSGELGRWIALIGGASAANHRSTRVYSAGDSNQQLSLKVEQVK